MDLRRNWRSPGENTRRPSQNRWPRMNMHSYGEDRRPDENWRSGGDICLTCDVKSQRRNSEIYLFKNKGHRDINVTVQPLDKLEFSFKVSNIKNTDLQLVSTEIDDPQGGFVLSDDSDSDEGSLFLKKATCICEAKKGDLKMTITFKLKNNATQRDITFYKNVSVIIEGASEAKASPYRNKKWTAKTYVPAVKTEYNRRTNTLKYVQRLLAHSHSHLCQLHGMVTTINDNIYDVPRALTNMIDSHFDKKMLEKLDSECEAESKYDDLIAIMNEKRTKGNYEDFYHNLLWLDELKELENIEKYNMSEVVLKKECSKEFYEKIEFESDSDDDFYSDTLRRPRFNIFYYKLEVPGLSKKRPSLMQGDRAIISLYDPKTNEVEYEHEGYIKDVKKNFIFIGDLDESFQEIFKSNTSFNVRFITNRTALEQQHKVVGISEEWRSRLFPEPVPFVEPKKNDRFFNKQIGENAEQKAAVEHILSHTSDPAPYLVFGPPGTGKTMTIVETIIQIVKADPNHKVWVCTNSNMAADHVALQLLKYKPLFATDLFLLRANSKDRDWDIMPNELREVSNGTSRNNCQHMKNSEMYYFRIVVSTLLHAAKYAQPTGDLTIKLSHLFIDEAAQATEPSCLVPMKLLSPRGQLVLAGDPCQLGPVIMSKLAKEFGLGMSLMEHLYNTYTNLYGAGCAHQHQYITMLVNNFRSDADILAIPNEQFYGGKLKALAPQDPLSRTSILGRKGGDRSIVFHSVDSKEQKLGRIPSFMNQGELKMVQTYIIALTNIHKVPTSDIGVISPYLRQVELIKDWLNEKNDMDLEVGTVEAFQGKEKRVIIVSTVRGGGTPTGDLRADLGFLVDKQRFNVAVTRAKAKLIVIGNCVFLKQDELWNSYIQRCKDLGTFHTEISPALKQLTANFDNLKL